MRPLSILTLTSLLLGPITAQADNFPADLTATKFSGPETTPSPACLCVSATGEVFVGVDKNGSLGLGPGKGLIIKLIDKDKDGTADSHTTFATLDNVRGLIAINTKLYVLHTAYGPDGKSIGMDLVSLDDTNNDGVADAPPTILVKNICSASSINARGTDHSTNGIRMGIDGWIYIAVGDFGFHNATGTDGTTLTLLGGGIARVRPDGSELEMYTTGTRNIYDVAIDPFMNCFTRGNTNDGGNWNVRFLHHLQSAEYGYPRLFLNFASEIIPALEDIGGGSGVGSFYLSEPTWPDIYNNNPLMADWGRQAIFIHRLTVDGASFTEKIDELFQVSQVTDLDVDPSGQMFVSAWDGAGYEGSQTQGYILRVTPKDWKPRDLPSFPSLTTPVLVDLVKSNSATTRFYASQELITRPDAISTTPALTAIITDQSLPLNARVAALFTLGQIIRDPSPLLTFTSDLSLAEFAMRAATDRLPRIKTAKLPSTPFEKFLTTGTERQKATATIAIGRLGNVNSAQTLLTIPFVKPPPESTTPTPTPRHSTPNPSILVPHLAAHALIRLNAVDACLKAIGTTSEDLALWALSNLHNEKTVNGLLALLKTNLTPETRTKIINTLARLYQQEAPYDGSWWWSTRPDTRGPYYKPITWSASPKIAEALHAEWEIANPTLRTHLAFLNDTERLGIEKLGSQITPTTPPAEVPTVDLADIASKQGAVGTTPIEDLILSMGKLQPNHKRGEELYTQQGCVACHALKVGGPALGPFLGQIGSIMTPSQIATAIVRPNDTISQGFQTIQITLKDGSIKIGFAVETTADQITLRDLTGAVSLVKIADIQKEEHLPLSMMPEGLTNSLSLDDLAALVHFLASHK